MNLITINTLGYGNYDRKIKPFSICPPCLMKKRLKRGYVKKGYVFLAYLSYSCFSWSTTGGFFEWVMKLFLVWDVKTFGPIGGD